MEAQLQEQLDRIERALTQLTRSISSYKPAPEAAKELIAANISLDKGITELAIHQSNHQRIQDLRNISTGFDVQLATHMRSLSTLRQSIKAVTLPGPLAGSNAVRTSDIIAFGHATAPFLAPASFKPPSALREAAAAAATTANSKPQAPQTSAKATPSEATPSVKVPGTTIVSPEAGTPAAVSGGAGSASAALDNEEGNRGLHSLSDADRAFLDPNTGTPFVPWISEIMINSSQLKQYQGKPQEVLARLENDRVAFEAQARNAQAGSNSHKQHSAEQEPGCVTVAQGNEQTARGASQIENLPDTTRAEATFQDWDD